MVDGELRMDDARYAGAHAPNEHIRLDDLARAVAFNCHMFSALAQSPPSDPA